MALIVHGCVFFLLWLIIVVGQEICSRQYNNRILLGTMPIARTPADSGLDCLSQCIDKQPKCKAAVYYQFFNGEKRICQLYAVNSASAGVEMAFDSPTQRTDVTILYEIPDNCAENDDNGALGTLEQLFRDVAGTNNGTLAVKNGESQPDDIAAINNSTSEAENGKLQPHDNATTNGTLEAKNQQPQPQGVAGTNNGSLESGDTELQQLQQVNNPEDENQRQLQLQQQQQQLLQQQLLQQQLQQQQQLQLQQLQQHQQTPCINSLCNRGCPAIVPGNCPLPLPAVLPQVDESNWNAWGEWSACSASCGQGQKTRTRTCSSTSVPCGIGSAEQSVEMQFCETTACVGWSDWAPWTPCTASCGQGTQTRTRECSAAGQCSGPSQDMQTCFFNECPTWTEWCAWSVCSVSCNEGLKTRTRICPSLGISGGPSQCAGASVQTEPCNEVPCPLWSEWCAWGSCSSSCGSGEQTRTRTCSNGVGCAGPSTSSQRCDNAPCPHWSEWGGWGACSTTCGLGTVLRTRQCQNGVDCGFGPTSESRLVDAGPCPVWSMWGFWCECSASCGGGQQSRTRQCLSGSNCQGNAVEAQSCNTHACPSWTPWCEWSACSGGCGAGVQARSRTCQGGAFAFCAGQAYEQQPCTGSACPTWGEWLEWSPCSVSCGQGQQTRNRQCSNVGGCGDGATQEMKFCELPACSQPVVISSSCDPCSGGAHLGQLGQCQWTQWSEWGACEGGGICQRNRICGGGGICECSGLSVDTKTCESIEPIKPIEAIDERPILLLNQDLDQNSSSCDWATWGAWSNCDKTCGGGTRQRTRNCIGDNGSGNVTSAACLCTGELAETEPCGAEPCPASNATKTGEEGVIIPLEGAIINGNG